MRLFCALVLCALIASYCPAARADKEIAANVKEVVAEPAAITPGQLITLRWYFTGDKVTVSGGRFGKGVVVTGRQKLTDKPLKTTRYTYDVYYHAPATLPDGRKEIRPLHARYDVVVEVVAMPPLSLYHASCGWQVNYLNGWQKASIDTADQPKDGLVFFQPEEDAVERLAVATMPAKEMTAADLMQQIQADLPSHYDQIQVLSRDEITYQHAPAIYTTFSAIDLTHPGTRTQSIVLAFVRDGQAYVVSARTVATRYNARRPILERLIKSFTVASKSASVATELHTATIRTK
jgi:hypothetical protein